MTKSGLEGWSSEPVGGVGALGATGESQQLTILSWQESALPQDGLGGGVRLGEEEDGLATGQRKAMPCGMAWFREI